MKISVVAMTVVVVVGTLTAAPSALAAKAPYKNCSTFHVKYPSGIARSVGDADRVVARGYQRPKVNRKAFLKARKMNKRLGTPGDGVICEVAVPVTTPTEPRDVTTTMGATRAVYLQWNSPESDGNAPITGYVVRGPGSITVNGTRATVSGLAPDTEYTFEIRAVNVAGEGASISFTTRTNAETAPAPSPTTPSSSATRYSNCTEARAAGVTPIRRDTNPTLYAANTHLDRDKDGVACE